MAWPCTIEKSYPNANSKVCELGFWLDTNWIRDLGMETSNLDEEDNKNLKKLNNILQDVHPYQDMVEYSWCGK